jgi:hypothetical protein
MWWSKFLIRTSTDGRSGCKDNGKTLWYLPKDASYGIYWCVMCDMTATDGRGSGKRFLYVRRNTYPNSNISPPFSYVRNTTYPNEKKEGWAFDTK